MNLIQRFFSRKPHEEAVQEGLASEVMIGDFPLFEACVTQQDFIDRLDGEPDYEKLFSINLEFRKHAERVDEYIDAMKHGCPDWTCSREEILFTLQELLRLMQQYEATKANLDD